ncbi:tetratricopeptide repeat protein [Fulvivirgaceae bacterium PWU5]|uniref:Tetratricopeptide repeat protein n=1 Tax=Dawidia cretensis TaxID=2782350 RepID=A0AAP2DVI2_9BACT|nr:tetratricopeptide repeat protein [Dawidia cretensis]MBT1707169.1 tetratricopeptide repeat protein [Dawidia cretensis]
MRKPLTVLFLLISWQGAQACLNEYGAVNLAGRDLAGTDIAQTYPFAEPPYFRSFNRVFSENFVASHDLPSVPADDYKTRSDIAFHLTRLGRYRESLAILQDLVKHYPHEYNILSNLGTVYELNNMPDLALRVLRATNKRFPDGHHGSEWVHLKVLEAKLRVRNDPHWLEQNRVLDLGITEASPDTSQRFMANMKKLWDATYQLHERLPFTRTPDPILANIINELGDAIAIEYSMLEAYKFYYMGLQYDTSDIYGMQAKQQALIEAMKKGNIPVPTANELNRFFPRADSIPLIRDHDTQYSSSEKQMERVLAYQEEEYDRRNPFPWNWVGAAVVLVAGYLYIRRIRPAPER